MLQMLSLEWQNHFTFLMDESFVKSSDLDFHNYKPDLQKWGSGTIMGLWQYLCDIV